ELAAATARAGMPWIAKGILTVEAAEAAMAAGASAILVSNHGGRQVDPSPASLDVLPEIAAAVAGQVPILLDSGVRTGADVFLALALGASAVVIGRLTAYGLAAAGEYGVRRTIELLTQELHILMTLAGIPDIASFTRGTVAPRLTGRRDGYPCGRQRRGRDAERRGRAALVGARELGRHRSRRRHRRRSFSVVRGGLSLRGQVFLVREVSLLPVRKDCVRLLALPSLARELVDLLLCVLHAALRDCLGERGLVVGWQLACLKRRVS